MTSLSARPFEQEFPNAFAEAVRGLVEGAPLDQLLDHLCRSISRQIEPAAVHLRRDPEPSADTAGTHDAKPDGPTTTGETPRADDDGCEASDIELSDGRRWGRVLLTVPSNEATGAGDPGSIATFVAWVIDRHEARRRTVATIDRERQLIAGQLHDDSIQAMTAISLNLQRLARSPGVDRDQVEHLLHLANDAIERLRHMMFALHPPDLADAGLVVTIEDYLDGFIAPSGLITSVHGSGDVSASPEITALAFRLTRAAVHNAWKHARAGRLDVSVELVEDRLKIVVDDDGIGFDVAPGRHEVGHAGIEYSKDLAHEVGGTYSVRSAPGEGTTVTIVLPTS